MSSEFWNMGGYAVYIWSSFGVAAAIYLWNFLAPRLRRAEILKQLTDSE